MSVRSVGASVAIAAATVAGAAIAGRAALGAEGRDASAAAAQKPLRFFGAHLFIEVSASDGDAALRMDVDGDAFRRLTVRDPKGRTVMDVAPKRHLRRYGLTGFDAEAGDLLFRKVPFGRLKARFPEGRYTFSATTIEGRRLIGSDRLTHHIARRPAVSAPAKNALVDPGALVVTWSPVTKPTGIEIVRYRVVVSKDGTDRELSMDLGALVSSVAIPTAFLDRGAKYDVEVVARERSGNETVTEVPFKTAG
jgi:hypothetical protein